MSSTVIFMCPGFVELNKNLPGMHDLGAWQIDYVARQIVSSMIRGELAPLDAVLHTSCPGAADAAEIVVGMHRWKGYKEAGRAVTVREVADVRTAAELPAHTVLAIGSKRDVADAVQQLTGRLVDPSDADAIVVQCEGPDFAAVPSGLHPIKQRYPRDPWPWGAAHA